jgi:hypothetical protein
MALYRLETFVLVAWSVAATAAAQVVQPPARSTRPSSDRTRQELTVQGNVLGGYDDNLTPVGAELLAPRVSGYTGFADTTLLYKVENSLRSLEASAGGYTNTDRNVGFGPRYGGEQRFRARTGLGRRTQIAVSQGLRYAPDFSLGLFGAVQEDSGRSNTENPTNALSAGGSWMTAVTASVARQWSRRTTMDAGYSFDRMTYVDGRGFDSSSHTGSVGFAHSVGRSAGFRATYQHADGRFEQVEGRIVPIVTRTADLGLTYARRLSPTRQLSFTAGSGASYVTTVASESGLPAEYWTPAGYGTIRLDIARSWSLGGDYRRSTSVLQGDTPEPFTSHTAQASVGGDVNQWLQSVFAVGFANGVSGGRTVGGALGRYDSYTGTVQARFRLSDGWSSLVGFTRFHYRLNAAASQSLGVSRALERNALRVGFSWSLPVIRSR